MRHVVLYLHSAMLAGLLALLTADTADVALYHDGFASFGAAAGYVGGCVVRDQGDQVLGAGGYAFAAGFTFFFIYNGYAVDDVDCIEGTGFGAVTETEAAVAADFRTAVWHVGHHGAVFDAGVGVLYFGLFTVTCAMYEGHLAGCLCDLFAHDSGDSGGYGRAADGTSVGRGFAFGDGGCHTVTSGVAAATTVIAGKGFSYGHFAGICVYMEGFTGDSQ